MNITFIEDTFTANIDHRNYLYAMCECTQVGQALQVDRPDQPGWVRFNCPCCGKELGIVAAIGKTKLALEEYSK